MDTLTVPHNISYTEPFTENNVAVYTVVYA